jgi:hypothetical protein
MSCKHPSPGGDPVTRAGRRHHPPLSALGLDGATRTGVTRMSDDPERLQGLGTHGTAWLVDTRRGHSEHSQQVKRGTHTATGTEPSHAACRDVVSDTS